MPSGKIAKVAATIEEKRAKNAQKAREFRANNPNWLKAWRTKYRDKLLAREAGRRADPAYREKRNLAKREARAMKSADKRREECEKARLWYREHPLSPEQKAVKYAKHKEWRATKMTAEQRKKYRATCKEYVLAHAERLNKAKREWLAKTVAVRRKQCREWRAKNIEHAKAIDKGWREANREKCNAWSREYAKQHPDKIREMKKKWGAANTEKVNAYARARRIKLLGLRGAHTPEEILVLFEKQKRRCANRKCRAPISAEKKARNRFAVDHVMPVELDGSNDIANIQLLCKPCNSKKKAKHPDKWAAETGVLFC